MVPAKYNQQIILISLCMCTPLRLFRWLILCMHILCTYVCISVYVMMRKLGKECLISNDHLCFDRFL